MRKSRSKFRLLEAKDSATGADTAEIDVKIDKKIFPGIKRIFRTREQVLKLPAAELVALVNYAEDLEVRKDVKRANSDEASAKMRRMKATRFVNLPDQAEYKALYDEICDAKVVDFKRLDKFLDKVYEDEIDEDESE